MVFSIEKTDEDFELEGRAAKNYLFLRLIILWHI